MTVKTVITFSILFCGAVAGDSTSEVNVRCGSKVYKKYPLCVNTRTFTTISHRASVYLLSQPTSYKNRSDMADPRLKTIKIKTGVVKRLAKEKTVYEKEADQQKNRIEKLKSEGTDEYNIRKQEEVLQESLMMVPDCQRRLVVAYHELKNILDTEKDLHEVSEYQTALAVLEEASKQLPQTA